MSWESAQVSAGLFRRNQCSQERSMNLKRVLLADSLTPVLTTASALLQGSFDIVGTAANGQAAIDATLQLEPDLAVLDISLPGKNGLEVARELKTRASKTKIIFLTVHEDTDIIAACFSAGAMGYVVKALMDSDLMLALRDALMGRLFVSHVPTSSHKMGMEQNISCVFDFDLTHKIIRCRIDGVVTDETLKEYYRLCSKYGAMNPTFAGIFDMSAVIFMAVSAQTIRELAMRPPALPDPDILRVIVAGSDAMFGWARMFDLQGSETRPNLHVVRTEKEALAVLGIRDARFSGSP
jgi:CheY-like chemotaxis protein